MSDWYQPDRQWLEHLQQALTRRQVATEIVVPNPARPYPALNIYQPGRRYAVDSVWFYDAGEPLPGSRHRGATTPTPVYVWGGNFEHVADARQVETVAERIASTYPPPTE